MGPLHTAAPDSSTGMNMKKHRRLKTILAVLLCVVLALVIGFGAYVSNYYHADSTADKALQSKDIEVAKTSDGTISFRPRRGSDTGLIFYPGGKVEYTAYAPLMKEYAENGIACVLLKMPFNLAVFDINAAEDVYDNYPEIKHWYIGGHSLGGAMAAYYASKHANKLEGLILLGAYSTEDLSNTDLKIALIDGTHDEVINKKKVAETKNNYPENARSYMISGGNHSQFGSYGHQKGDGTATISPEKQWQGTVADSLKVMAK